MAEMAMAIAIMAIISNTKLVLIEIFFTDDLKFACRQHIIIYVATKIGLGCFLKNDQKFKAELTVLPVAYR